MKVYYRILLLLFLFAITINLNACNQSKVPSSSATSVYNGNGIQDIKPEQTFSAPDFNFLDDQGNEISLRQLSGKPVFINFWASW